MLAVFEPGTKADDIFSAITRAEARPIRPTAFGFIWIVTSPSSGLAGRLIREGALPADLVLPVVLGPIVGAGLPAKAACQPTDFPQM